MVWDTMVLWLNDTWTKILAGATTFWTTFKTNMFAIWQTIVDGIKAIFTPIGTFFSDLWTSVKNSAFSAFDGIVSRVQSVISSINSVTSAIGKVVSTPINAISNVVKKFAEGGIVTKPTLGLVGEAGPEAIVPLNKATGMGGVNITITGNTFMGDEQGAIAIGDMIVSRLKMNLRLIS
jgi:phage-related minor tail protein